MPAPVYATPSDWCAWTGLQDAPDAFVGLVRNASAAVREATALWAYDVDPATGGPADDDLAEAFRDATCAQIAFLDSAAADPSAGGVLAAGIETSVGLGSARITYAGLEQVAAGRAAALQGLCPDAARILRLVDTTSITVTG